MVSILLSRLVASPIRVLLTWLHEKYRLQLSSQEFQSRTCGLISRTFFELKMKIRKRQKTETLYFYVFISPWLLGFIFLTAYPILLTIIYSFNRVGPFDLEYIGLENYHQILYDANFYQSILVTIKYVIISIPLNTLAALFLALLLNQKIPFLSFWRTIYYLPSILSGVAVALLWKWLLNPEFGIINGIVFRLIGVEGPRWFYSEEWVIPSYWLMGLWGVGSNMIIFLGGLQSIPTALYESAEIDGANGFSKFTHITLPLVSPVILYSLISNLIFSMRIFTEAYVISERGRGGPNNASLFYMLYVFQNGFKWSRFGYASALSIILLIITLMLTLVLLRILKHLIYYHYED